jgi:guanylate kinase
MKRKLLVLAGPSGGGKNYMTDALVEKFPEVFEQLPQYTTREKRTPDENTYYFITDSHYDAIKSTLIARTEINGVRYGTVPSMKEDKVGIIIANRMGIDNLQEYLNMSNAVIDFEVFFLGIDSNSPAEREGRTKEYVEEERQLLSEVVEHWLLNDALNNDFLTPEKVLNYLKKVDFIQPENLRKTEVLVGNRWEETRLSKLKPNQIIRMFESDGTPVPYDKGNDFHKDDFELMVASYPEFSEKLGRWIIQTSVSPSIVVAKYIDWLGKNEEEFKDFLDKYPHYKPFEEAFKIALDFHLSKEEK